MNTKNTIIACILTVVIGCISIGFIAPIQQPQYSNPEYSGTIKVLNSELEYTSKGRISTSNNKCEFIDIKTNKKTTILADCIVIEKTPTH